MSMDPIDSKLSANAPLASVDQGRMDQLQELAKGGEKNLEEVAAHFESLFLGMLIKQMWESVEKSELFEESPGKPIYDGMFTTMLADHIAENGGVGIAKSMVEQLKTTAAAAYEDTSRENKSESGPIEKGAPEKGTLEAG